MRKKIVTLKKAIVIAQKARREGKIVVVTNGCFDLLHAGHVRSLEWAKAQGDVLIVALNSDVSVKKNKGQNRPFTPDRERAFVVAGLESVDYVYVFSSKVAAVGYKKIKPNIWVKGREGKTHPDFPASKKIVEDAGGTVRFSPMFPGRSTTNIIESIQKTKA